MALRSAPHPRLKPILQAAAASMLLCTGDVAVAGSVLADAVMRGDREAALKLIDGRADVNERQAGGATALHWAVHRDDIDLTEALLDAGADVSAANREGVTPLALAAINGNAVVIERLLDAGANPNTTLANGETALMLAARTGNVEALETLLDHGANVNAVEALRGTTALMWAAANQNPAAVRLLVSRGADVSLRSKTIPLGRGPYLAETARDRIEAYRRGIGQAGTSVEVDLDGKKVKGVPDAPALSAEAIREDDTKKRGDSASDRDVSGEEAVVYRRNRGSGGGLTALVFAAREGDLESARALVEAGADVNQVTEYGWTALLAATQNRFYRLGKYLLDHGADPNLANKGGWTPLYIATDNRNIEGGDYPTRKPDMDHLEFIRLLLAHGADPNARMKSSTETRTIFTHQWLQEEGCTPFIRASQSGDMTLMKLLLQHGADPLAKCDDGVTALMVASGIGWVEGVTYEWSPEQTLEAVKLLIELGVDVNAQDTVDGRTALMGAAHKGRNDVVQVLVDRGADLTAHDIGSRDSLHKLAGVTWQAIDYADGLVRVGVQSAIPHPETAALLRKLMTERGLPVPPEGRTLDSICVTELCSGDAARD
jgi:ankyrin repeat protein